MPVKVINDPIHGTIEVHKFAELIMANPKFQRLRQLKQLGITYLVYPSGTHSRFEHSVGTYHLAWQLARNLQRHCSGECQLTDNEVTCVALAGLCHDLGHGPFSHLWESLLRQDNAFKDYHHEAMSVELFDSIVDDVSASGQQEFAEFMADPHEASGKTNRNLIKDLILGGPEGADIPPRRQFLYEIVNNKRTGFDVDKWDYINRDSYYLGLHNKFDCQRQMAMLRVLPCRTPDGRQRNLLVIRDKQVFEYIQLLVSRRSNHYIGYQHIKVIGFEKILGDALRAARSHLRAEAAAGRPISERARRYLLENPAALGSLAWLTDERLVLLLSEDCGPTAAELMARLQTRRTYVRLATVMLVLRSTAGKEPYAEQEARAKEAVRQWNSRRDDSTLAEIRNIDYGAGTEHPLGDVFYYCKADTEGRKCDIAQQLSSELLLSSLHLTIVRLYERTPVGQDEASFSRQRTEAKRSFLEKFSAFGFVEMVE